jgi:chromosome partitioning protein
MGKTVAVLAQKGGAGKTTLSVHLAVIAGAPILDADPQGSARAWAAARGGAPPLVEATSSASLRDDLARQNGAALVLVDTPPAHSALAAAIARAADFVLVPCRPSALDFAAIGATAAIVKAAGKPAAFVLSACPTGNPLAPPAEIAETRLALEALGLPVAPAILSQRRAFSRAVTSGEAVTEFDPKGKAADEIRALWKWLRREVGLETAKGGKRK